MLRSREAAHEAINRDHPPVHPVNSVNRVNTVPHLGAIITRCSERPMSRTCDARLATYGEARRGTPPDVPPCPAPPTLGEAAPPLAAPESSASVGETAKEPRGGTAGGFAAYRRAGFTAATKRADKARRDTGAGRGKARDVSRRRSHPTTADPHRWTRPFHRDSDAAPRQGAKSARPSDSGLPESEVPRQNRCRAKHAPTGLDSCPSGWRYGQSTARLSRGVPSGRWPRMSWRQRRLSPLKPPPRLTPHTLNLELRKAARLRREKPIG